MIEERLFLLATFENIGFFFFKNIYKKVDEPKMHISTFFKVYVLTEWYKCMDKKSKR